MKKRKKSGHIARTRGEQIGYAIIMLVLGLFAFSTIYPVWHVVMYSISDSKLSMSGGFFFWPRGFSLKSYKMVFQTSQIWIAYRNSILVTFVGTIMSVGLSAITAYPLSRKRLHGRNFLSMVVFFTMLFSGGMIPLYLTVKQFGMMDTIWALVLPGAISTYNMMICRSAMESVPNDLFENASLEGASDFYMLTHIAVPLIKPTLAVLTLYYAVARYNDFFNAMLYLGKSELQPLQMFLRRILILSSSEILQQAGTTGAAAAAQNTLKIRYVCIVLAAVPIFCITPFVQKYLVSGTMLGAVKG